MSTQQLQLEILAGRYGSPNGSGGGDWEDRILVCLLIMTVFLLIVCLTK